LSITDACRLRGAFEHQRTFGQVDAHATAQTKKFERCSNWRKSASGDDTFGFGIDRYGLAIDGLAAMTKARRS
jgi:hypothetical protein